MKDNEIDIQRGTVDQVTFTVSKEGDNPALLLRQAHEDLAAYFDGQPRALESGSITKDIQRIGKDSFKITVTVTFAS